MEANIRTIREGLKLIADVIEEVDNKPKRKISYRELSGDHINGGKITQFSSTGIVDKASRGILEVSDNGLRVRYADIQELTSPLKVQGNLTVYGDVFSDKLTVNGEIKAGKLTVNELTADIRIERTDSLQFLNSNGNTSGIGLIWNNDNTQHKFLFRSPDQFWSSENLSLPKDKAIIINSRVVLNETGLGSKVTNSNLEVLGCVKNLTTTGSLNFDNHIFYNHNFKRLGIGTDSPNATLHILDKFGDFKIDANTGGFSIGSNTTTDISIVTDDTARIQISATGEIVLNKKIFINGQLGIGVKNVNPMLDLATSRPISIQNKKIEVGGHIPSAGIYNRGDMVWNSWPMPGAFVGWICIESGEPGKWKPFGQIQN